MKEYPGPLIIFRGAGDLATGAMVRLFRSGYRVAALELADPTAIRRNVAFSEAVYEGSTIVEGITAQKIDSAGQVVDVLAKNIVPILIDPECACIGQLQPDVVVDAILAKSNQGTTMAMAPLVIGLGPGFAAGQDVHAVIETQRGHNLGRVYREGSALPNTGVPGVLGGESVRRVVRSPASGVVECRKQIGDVVEAGDVILTVTVDEVVYQASAQIGGVLRGLIRNGLAVFSGLKIADIDPRPDAKNYTTVSDKALAVGGGILEALLTNCVLPGSRQ